MFRNGIRMRKTMINKRSCIKSQRPLKGVFPLSVSKDSRTGIVTGFGGGREVSG